METGIIFLNSIIEEPVRQIRLLTILLGPFAYQLAHAVANPGPRDNKRMISILRGLAELKGKELEKLKRRKSFKGFLRSLPGIIGYPVLLLVSVYILVASFYLAVLLPDEPSWFAMTWSFASIAVVLAFVPLVWRWNHEREIRCEACRVSKDGTNEDAELEIFSRQGCFWTNFTYAVGNILVYFISIVVAGWSQESLSQLPI